MTISRIDEQPDMKRKERNVKSDSIRHCKHSDEDDDIKRFHGDGLVVRMHSNHNVLEIVGDGCCIVLSKNSGSVHVIGDGCKLHVNHNVGDIEYIGDGGRVLLGPDSSKEKVKFVGDGGKVILCSSPETVPKKFIKEQRRETYVQNCTCSCKEIINKECEDDHRSNMDNILNDMKERSQAKYEKRNEETRKSLRHPTVTKIITKIQSDGQCVTKRFGDSSLIVNSRGRPVTKSVSRTSGTNIELK
ncbi:hypothetical protein ALC56_08710 [Trachymyrmex septentrionalis]|uniref:Uncharacterized protein n=1 Tax=Trachymyrmex septentrionalis TaxID=34720 RepID=A0A195FA46_9HYME|nr:PREDICTED: uncharacterized protein LOC108750617 [Trachymyrmex septentrionalis]KYN36919.1 hypothetical protein ALC56_08710 [Trachymyrmex septentrionalis]